MIFERRTVTSTVTGTMTANTAVSSGESSSMLTREPTTVMTPLASWMTSLDREAFTVSIS